MKRIAGAIATITIAGLGLAPGLVHAQGNDCYPPAPPEEPPAEAPDFGKITLTLDGPSIFISGHWLLPGSSYTLTVHSTPQVIGVGMVGSDGNFSSTFHIPSGLEPGEHTLVVTATVHDGTPTSTSMRFTVAAPADPSVDDPAPALLASEAPAVVVVASSGATTTVAPASAPAVAPSQVASAAATDETTTTVAAPIVASFAPSSPASAASKLPTTGGSPVSSLRLGSIAVLTGLGMVMVSSVRRRRRAGLGA